MTWLPASYPVSPSPAAWEFYDLEKDRHEVVNQYGNPKYRKVVAQLKEQLQRERQELNETDGNYPDFQKVIEAHWND